MFVRTNKHTCASGSAVEHLLAKEGVAGSIPVSRLEKRRIGQRPVLLFCEHECSFYSINRKKYRFSSNCDNKV